MIEKWNTKEGCQCFRFQEREPFERPWIIMLIALFLAAGTVTEYLVNGSLHSLTLNIIAFVFTFLWWLTMPMKANEVIIENTVHNLMDDKEVPSFENAKFMLVTCCAFVNYIQGKRSAQ